MLAVELYRPDELNLYATKNLNTLNSQKDTSNSLSFDESDSNGRFLFSIDLSFIFK
jgi:hypothetical protein